jgi:toluene monooxygenase system protein E
MSRTAPPLRTYSHLAGRQRVPTEYDITTTGLLYYVRRGFELDVPVGSWYARHQTGGQLTCSDWERFADPRETTYSDYTTLQAEKESHLDATVRSMETTGADARLDAEWRATLERVLPPLRYVWHGFQMAAAYVGQMAPAGRLVLVAMFQAGDEMRRIHRVAYRMAQLRQNQPDFGSKALAEWQEAPAWQPLRRALERTLVAYDWGECFAALCLCLKPTLDHLMIELGGLARERHDVCLGEFLTSFDEDARWHRAWAEALVRLLVEESPDNAATLRSWLERWLPGAREAAAAVADLFGPGGPAAAGRAQAAQTRWLAGLELAGR